MRSKPEPTYRGRTLGEWVDAYAGGPPSDTIPFNEILAKRKEEAEAIRKIGTNALPHLIKWIEYEPPGWRTRIYTNYPRIARWLEGARIRDKQREARAEATERTISLFGRDAERAIPELTRLILSPHSHRVPERAAFVLQSLGEPGLHGYLAGLRNEQPDVRESIALGVISVSAVNQEALLAVERNSQEVILALQRTLKDPDPKVRSAAGLVLFGLTNTLDQIRPGSLTNSTPK